MNLKFLKCLNSILFQGINSTEHSSQENPEAKTERQQYRNNLKRIKNENKAALTIFAIIAGFLVCWMPFVFVNFTAALINFHIPEWLDVLSTLLVATGSMVNPLFYAWLDSTFRLAFKRLLFPIFGRVGSAPITAVSNYSGAGANLWSRGDFWGVGHHLPSAHLLFDEMMPLDDHPIKPKFHCHVQVCINKIKNKPKSFGGVSRSYLIDYDYVLK